MYIEFLYIVSLILEKTLMVGGVLTERFRIYIYIYDLDTYICILNFYTQFIDFGKNADGGGGF